MEEDFLDTETNPGKIAQLALTLDDLEKVIQLLPLPERLVDKNDKSNRGSPADQALDPPHQSGVFQRPEVPAPHEDPFLLLISGNFADMRQSFDERMGELSRETTTAKQADDSSLLATFSTETLFALEKSLEFLGSLLQWWRDNTATERARYGEFFYCSCTQSMRLIDALGAALDVVPSLDVSIRHKRRVHSVPREFLPAVEATDDITLRVPFELVAEGRALGHGGLASVFECHLFQKLPTTNTPQCPPPSTSMPLAPPLETEKALFPLPALALKKRRLDVREPQKESELEEEGARMASLHHRNVCHFVGFRLKQGINQSSSTHDVPIGKSNGSFSLYNPTTESQVDGLLLEALPQGNLKLKLKEKSLSFPMRMTYAFQLTKALRYLHCSGERGGADAADHGLLSEEKVRVLGKLFNRGLVHSDIKAENAAISQDGNYAKWIDFGSAISQEEWEKRLKDGQYSGTFVWMAPEFENGSAPPSSVTDVYSLGMMYLELLTGDNPWGYGTKVKGPTALKNVRLQGLQEEEHMQPLAGMEGLLENFSSFGLLKALIQDCVQMEPSARPGISEVAARIQQICVTGWRELEDAILKGVLQVEDSTKTLKECYKQLRRFPECPPHCWLNPEYPPNFKPNFDRNALRRKEACGPLLHLFDGKAYRCNLFDLTMVECYDQEAMESLVKHGAAFQHRNVLQFLGFAGSNPTRNTSCLSIVRSVDSQLDERSVSNLSSGLLSPTTTPVVVFEAIREDTATLESFAKSVRTNAGSSALPLLELLDALAKVVGVCQYIAEDRDPQSKLRWDPVEMLKPTHILMLPKPAKSAGASRSTPKCLSLKIHPPGSTTLDESHYIGAIAELYCSCILGCSFDTFLKNASNDISGAISALQRLCSNQGFERWSAPLIEDMKTLLLKGDPHASQKQTLAEFHGHVKRFTARAWFDYGYAAQQGQLQLTGHLNVRAQDFFLEAAKFPEHCDAFVWLTLGDELQNSRFDQCYEFADPTVGAVTVNAHQLKAQRLSLLDGSSVTALDCYTRAVRCQSEKPRPVPMEEHPGVWVKLGFLLAMSGIQKHMVPLKTGDASLSPGDCFQRSLNLCVSSIDNQYKSRALFGLAKDAQRRQETDVVVAEGKKTVFALLKDAVDSDPAFGPAAYSFAELKSVDEPDSWTETTGKLINAILAETPHSPLAKKAWKRLAELCAKKEGETVTALYTKSRCDDEAKWEDPRTKTLEGMLEQSREDLRRIQENNRKEQNHLNQERGRLVVREDTLNRELEQAKKELRSKVQELKRKSAELNQVRTLMERTSSDQSAQASRSAAAEAELESQREETNRLREELRQESERAEVLLLAKTTMEMDLKSAESYREAAEEQAKSLRQRWEDAQKKELDLVTKCAQLEAEKAKIEAESKLSLIQAVQANDYQLCLSICSRRPEELGVMRWLRDPNQKGKRVCTTALLEAIKLNRFELVKLFLPSYSHHVDFEATDEDGQTALILAVRYAKNNYPLVTLLCNYIKNPKAVKDGLVEPGGLNPEAVDKMGRNALHWAACNHTVDAPGKMCSYIRGFWIPVDAKDKDGMTPYDIAKQEPCADAGKQGSLEMALRLA